MSVVPPERIELPGATLIRQTAADAEDAAASVARSLDHLRPWMPWATEAATDVEGQRARGAATELAWTAGTEYIWCLRMIPDGRLAGTFGIHRRVGPGGVDIGYWLDIDHTGRGLATAAARALTDVAFSLEGVERVEIHTDVGNIRSAAIPQRLGYRLDRIDDVPAQAPAETGRHQIWVKDPHGNAVET
jgi:RimJ/RimL family protein N-acetyltransferase